ncbi:phage tail protein, partial [Klebsiella pneumoniae]
RLVIADSGANVIRAEMVMFPQVGGFWLREAALYDDDGVCLALASLPPSYKPLLAEGSGRQQAVNLWIAVNNTADVRLMTDPAVVIASLGEVDRA